MKKKLKLLLGVLSVALINIPLVLANNTNNFGKIEISKSAIKNDITYGRSADITLEVSGSSYDRINTIDIVLVLDRSASMNSKPTNNSNESKMVLTKKEAINLVNNFIPTDGTYKNNIKIGIVTFGNTTYNDYSTNSLSSSNSTLKNLINSIPDISNSYGTNIHEGLIKADILLKNSTANKKVIILLSDGEANKFTYNNRVYGNGNRDVCYIGNGDNCTKSNPFKMTTSMATEIKKYATIYTIGFGIGNNNEAIKLLKNNVASNENNYYLAENANELQNNFKNIINSITTIAKNIVVTDTIPNNFDIKENSINSTNNTTYKTKNNNDGTTTITWNIDLLDITKEYKLKYNIIAKSPYYGNMYTNVSATLTGTANDDNPFYKESNSISLTFDKPSIPIPSITVDDDYTTTPIYRGEEFTVTENLGLLKNDKLTKQTDNNASVKDKIVIKENSLSCGKPNDIVINNNGSFTYKSNNNCLGNISFEYYIVTNVNDTEVISNTSKVTMNVIKKSTNYTVKYLDFNTKSELANKKEVNNKYLYDEITETAIDVKKYNLIGDKELIKTLEKENEEIIFYYVKKDNITYVVDYYYDNNLDINKREIVTSNTVDDIINTYKDKKTYGYTIDHTSNLPLTISEDINNNTIKVYYKRCFGNVIVKFVDNNGIDIKPSETIKNLVNEDYITKKMDIEGYSFSHVIGAENGLIKEEDTIITYVYDFIIPKTGINDNYNKEIISISCLLGIFTLFIFQSLRNRHS